MMLRNLPCTVCRNNYNCDENEPAPYICPNCRVDEYKKRQNEWHEKYIIFVKGNLAEKECQNKRLENIEKWIYDFERNIRNSEIRRMFR